MKIIVAPLNWGIGHATRMIPIIQHLIGRGVKVHLASDGDALAVLKKEFPTLPATSLPSYHIQYKYKQLYKNSFSLAANMLRTIPQEKKAIGLLAKSIQAQIIISDNRFGCHTPFTQNIFITHQLNILSPLAEKGINSVNRFLMKPFDEIWVPDFPQEPSLAGKLSHGSTLKVQYIGGLSRFEKIIPQDKTIDVLAILSGPEPQRSYLEKELIQQFAASTLNTTIISGQPSLQTIAPSRNINLIPFASSEALYQLIARSRTIISRSGYSTIMDYAALGLFAQADTKIIFIPTPGQPEQLYLAEKMSAARLVHSVSQAAFKLEEALQTSSNLTAKIVYPHGEYLKGVLDRLLL